MIGGCPKRATRSPRAKELLKQIGALFAIEEQIKGRDGASNMVNAVQKNALLSRLQKQYIQYAD